MSVLSDFIKYLLDHGKVGIAAVLVVVALAASAVRWGFEHRRAAAPPPSQTQHAAAGTRSQITQVNDVRADGDVTVSPTQHRG